MLADTTTTVRIVYLARLREAFGRDAETWALPADATDVAALVAALRARGGAWSHELAAGRAVRVAVNQVMASPSTPVRAGDEVALFPPVTGG
ncbi:MAG TPA: molybdopterin converting factor subunit 1 [Casimicrobiaceae bacterium]|jgi:molybdopterin synthase sulfur carrier subunit|nr:molybdopterin converting factor subunit 1 [Casimicrobiaceae bacterium]